MEPLVEEPLFILAFIQIVDKLSKKYWPSFNLDGIHVTYISGDVSRLHHLIAWILAVGMLALLK